MVWYNSVMRGMSLWHERPTHPRYMCSRRLIAIVSATRAVLLLLFLEYKITHFIYGMYEGSMKKRDGTAKLLMGCLVATTEFSTKLQLLGPTTAYTTLHI